MSDKIKAFAELIEKEQRAKHEKFFTVSDPEAKEALVKQSSEVKVIPGKKYTKVDVGHSGKYMVVNDTGEIYGIKAYGVIHRGHKYGTLDTINDFYWGEYAGFRR